MLAAATLISLRETGWLLIILGVILFALSILRVAPMLSDKARQHGFFKTVLFSLLSAIASWAGGKGGRGQSIDGRCKTANAGMRLELCRIDHAAMGYHIFNTYKVNTEEVEATR